MRRWALCWCAAFALALVLPAAAAAAGPITSVLGGDTISGTAISCTVQSDGVRVCQGDYSPSGGPDTRLKSFAGSPLALYVILPPAPASGPDGDYPLIVQSHGWGDPPAAPAGAFIPARPATAGPGRATRFSS